MIGRFPPLINRPRAIWLKGVWGGGASFKIGALKCEGELRLVCLININEGTLNLGFFRSVFRLVCYLCMSIQSLECIRHRTEKLL